MKSLVSGNGPDALRRAFAKWALPNAMYFPQSLRDAIPGPELPGCDRCLILSYIDGDCMDTIAGGRVRLNFHVEESGKLTGKFAVYVDIEVDAARALAATLTELVGRLASGTAGTNS